MYRGHRGTLVRENGKLDIVPLHRGTDRLGGRRRDESACRRVR
jgi:hypothetical protein